MDYYRSVLPEIEEFDGFCSASLLVDHLGGRAVACSTYDSPTRWRASAGATELRSHGLRDLGAEDDVGEFDLALAHLHVPELV